MMYIVYIDIKLFYIISYRELLYRDICLYRVYRTSLVRILRCLKEELSWAIDKWLWLIINTMLFKTVIPLRI